MSTAVPDGPMLGLVLGVVAAVAGTLYVSGRLQRDALVRLGLACEPCLAEEAREPRGVGDRVVERELPPTVVHGPLEPAPDSAASVAGVGWMSLLSRLKILRETASP